jgi:membrane associated rhomboid family serine protease
VLVFFWTMIFWGSTQAALSRAHVGEPLDLLRLESGKFLQGEYWRLLSYQFLHAGPAHFLVNLLVLWFAGREIEPILGRVQFLWLCLIANVGGGAANLATGSAVPVEGFSAAVAAVLSAYATIMPELSTGVSFFHLFPLRFRAKYIAFMMVIFAAACMVTGTLAVIGPAGILFGSIFGWVWARRIGFGNPMWFQRVRFERRQREMRIERMSADDFMRLEIDPILEKISQQGMQSLTRAERRVLEQGREKLCTQAEKAD